MLETILLASSLFFCATQATYDDMSDEDFAAYLDFHDNVREAAGQYAESAGRGCVKGATAGAVVGKGFQALCLGCAAGATSEVAAEMAFPREKKD